MSVVASDLVNPELEASQTELWDLCALFLSNWSENVTINTAYVTDITETKSGDESRIGLIGRPYRTVSFDVLSWDTDKSSLLNSLATRAGTARSLVPLYCDETLTTQALSNSGTIYCDTSNRRFFAGARIAIAFASAPATVQHSLGVISEVHADRLVLSASLVGPFPAKSSVFPLIECDINLSTDLDILTDSATSGKLTFKEITGKSALPALTTPGTLLSPSHGGIPILTIPLQWDSLRGGSSRSGKMTSLGLGNVAEVYTGRPRGIRTLKFLQLSRSEAFSLLRFFDSRGGRNFPLWVPSPDHGYEVLEIEDNVTLRVASTGPFYDWAFRPYLFTLDTEGTYSVRKVTPIERAANGDRLTLDNPIDLSKTYSSIGLCLLCRFDTDEIEEQWMSDGVMQATLPVIEVLNDRPLPVIIPDYGTVDNLCDPEGLDAEDGDAGGPDDGDDEDVPGYLLYMQGQNCRTSAFDNVWLRVSDLPSSLPVTVHPGPAAGPDGVIPSLTDCYTFASGNPVSRTAGHMLVEYEVLADCAACQPSEWIGTRLCSDDSQHTIYQASNASRLLTGTFRDKINGVCFYFDPTLTVSSIPAEAQVAVRIEPLASCAASPCTEQWEQAKLCGYGTPYPIWQRTSSPNKMTGTWFDVLRGRCFYWPDPPVITSPGYQGDDYSHIIEVSGCDDPLCTVFTGFACEQVSDSTPPAQITATISGTGTAADGTFDLAQDEGSPCTWAVTSGGLTVSAVRTSVNSWSLLAANGGTLFSGTATVPSSWSDVAGIANTAGTGTGALTMTIPEIPEGSDPCSGLPLDCSTCGITTADTVRFSRPGITIVENALWLSTDNAYRTAIQDCLEWMETLPIPNSLPIVPLTEGGTSEDPWPLAPEGWFFPYVTDTGTLPGSLFWRKLIAETGPDENGTTFSLIYAAKFICSTKTWNVKVALQMSNSGWLVDPFEVILIGTPAASDCDAADAPFTWEVGDPATTDFFSFEDAGDGLVVE